MIGAELIADGVWHVELRRPEKRNALGETAYLLLADLLEQARSRADVHAVLLSSQGEVFCAGNDLTEFATHWPQPPHGPVVRFLQALHGLEVPIIAAVQGPAVGIGATMLLHCDLVVAAPEAFLRFPFVELGITVEGAASLLLPARIGHTRAMDMLLTGRRVTANEALSLGLISEISRDRPPVDGALELATSVAGKSSAAVRATKRIMRNSTHHAVARRFEEEIVVINDLLARRTGVVDAVS